MNLVCKIVALAAVGVGFYLGESGALGAPPRRNDESRDVRPGRNTPPERARMGDGQGRRPEMREHRRQAMRHFMKHHRHHHRHHGRPGGNFRGPSGGAEQGMHRRPQMRGGQGPDFQNDRRGPDARPNIDGGRRGPDFRGQQREDRGPAMRQQFDQRGPRDGGQGPQNFRGRGRGNRGGDASVPEGSRGGN